MYDIVGKRKWFFILSGTLILMGFGAMIYSLIQFGTLLRVGVDFTGGSRFVVQFTAPVNEDALREVFTQQGFDPTIQQLGESNANTWQIRTTFVDADQVKILLDEMDAQVAIIDRERTRYDMVDPAIGGEVTQAAAAAVIVASVIVLGFIWFSFRRVAHAFRYGACAIAGMIHNLLIATGFFAVMGLLRGWEVDALFLTAILTVVGFSVQDTIVVFDRIRENAKKRREGFEPMVNRSILEVIQRSITTQLNAMFVMTAILLFGGASLEKFIATWLVGMISGTYSSICIAVPLLVVWENGARRNVQNIRAAA
ncbi:MAG: protein translocase subunit SecF [Anaerolineae bacterium]|nr:protein translocase subunit SecF [Anaerolineae bacterium]